MLKAVTSKQVLPGNEMVQSLFISEEHRVLSICKQQPASN